MHLTKNEKREGNKREREGGRRARGGVRFTCRAVGAKGETEKKRTQQSWEGGLCSTDSSRHDRTYAK